MRTTDLLTATDEQLLQEFERQAATTVMAVAPIQTELQRRATTKLIAATDSVAAHSANLVAQTARLAAATEEFARSSERVERFTKLLLYLTILLLIAALPPALVSLAQWVSSR